jgi:hypothetical protein
MESNSPHSIFDFFNQKQFGHRLNCFLIINTSKFRLARTELLQELKIGLYKGFQFSIKIIGNIKALTLAMKLMPFNLTQ